MCTGGNKQGEVKIRALVSMVIRELMGTVMKWGVRAFPRQAFLLCRTWEGGMLLLFLLYLPAFANGQQRPTVTIPDGPLVGIPMETWMGRNIFAFRRIPYAAPPVATLRFQEPQPVQPWSAPLDAGLMSPRCPQDSTPAFSSFDEDCLYLNVYTPQLPTSSEAVSLPVLVYIHGGAFTVLSGADYGPRYLLDFDIVFVTLNYRLGALGFLSTEDAVVPGNMGLKDQVFALRWIQQNIAVFGGNPNDVTIGGTSAGAASVEYHFLSRMSRGLFRRGICMSGSSMMPSAYEKASLYKLNFLATQLDCPTNTTAAIVSCLMTASVQDILNAQTMLMNFFYLTPPLAFGPLVERAGSNPFLSRYPYEILRIGDIQQGSILFSIVTQEGLFPGAEFLGNTTGLNALNNDFLEYAPSVLDYLFTVTHEEINATSTKIREFYFGNETISAATNQSIIKMLGDRSVSNDVQRAARLQSYVQESPIYFYEFGYRGMYSVITELLSGTNTNWGTGHGDDTVYIFNSSYIEPSEKTPSDRAMIRVMSSLWANFAINGYPSVGSGVDWPPLERASDMNSPMNYLYIASPTSFTSNRSVFGNPNFWNNLPINEPMSGRPANDFL